MEQTEFITPDYETISVMEIRTLRELVNSSLVKGFSYQDYSDIIGIFYRVASRLEALKDGKGD